MNFKLQNFKLLKYKAADSFCNLKIIYHTVQKKKDKVSLHFKLSKQFMFKYVNTSAKIYFFLINFIPKKENYIKTQH